MTSFPRPVVEHYRDQQRLALTVLRQVRMLWAQMNPVDFDMSWQRIGPQVEAVLASGQFRAAAAGADSVDAILADLNIEVEAEAAVRVDRLAGVASSGTSLSAVLYEPVIYAKTTVGAQKATGRFALDKARSLLDGIVLTQIADAGRVAAGVAVAVRPRIGYVRMLNTPSCSRCVQLAGRFYKWNQGFQRHPRCDCRHIPSREDRAGDLRTDPKAYFDSLSPAEQDKAWTKAGAQAIRDGADMNQVVNVRRGAGLSTAGGLQTTKAFGRDLYLTTEGTSVRGIAGKALAQRGGTVVQQSGSRTLKYAQAPRLMPESIYEIAGDDRALAMRLLNLNGYIAT